jgi:hypothetical protein
VQGVRRLYDRFVVAGGTAKFVNANQDHRELCSFFRVSLPGHWQMKHNCEINVSCTHVSIPTLDAPSLMASAKGQPAAAYQGIYSPGAKITSLERRHLNARMRL